uniref:Ig-like domain-containing protein n=1 Tax=Maylandia zebra TaxID=106582 RepID=A0A3P9BEE6_9CICH
HLCRATRLCKAAGSHNDLEAGKHRSPAHFGAFPPTEAPRILEKPDSKNALPGSKVRFTLRVSGTPPLAIKWFKNKKEILPSAKCSVIKDNTSSSLELFSAKTSDSGEYVCEVQNAVGNQSVVPVLCNEHILSLHLNLNTSSPANSDTGLRFYNTVEVALVISPTPFSQESRLIYLGGSLTSHWFAQYSRPLPTRLSL